MAVLDAANRLRVANQWMREQKETCAFTKADLRAAVDAFDAWIDANQAAAVATLPAGFRNASTPTQKTSLFCYVLERRAGRLRADED